MCQIHHPQAEVCIPYQYQYPGYDPHLWQGSKYHQKDTPETRGGVLRSREVPPGLGRGPGEKHSPVGEDWDCNRVEMGLKRREQEEGE